MSTHDSSDEEVVCYSCMSIAESDSDKFSEFKGDDEHEDSLDEYEVHCAVLETGDLRSHEQSCNGDISITSRFQPLGRNLSTSMPPRRWQRKLLLRVSAAGE